MTENGRDNMKVLVTGSTQGIGKAIAAGFCKLGYEVIVHGSKNIEKATNVAAEIGASRAVVADLSDPEKARTLRDITGDVDILILNASVQYKEKWDEISQDTFDMQFNINVRSTLILMQEYIPAMKANGFGRVITLGSVNQYRAHSYLSLYSATKCAVMKLVECVAKDVAPWGVTVNNVSPGAISTPRNEKALADAEYNRKVVSGIPCGYVGEPEDCVGAVLMLCSDGGKYITGADLTIDGGMHL